MSAPEVHVRVKMALAEAGGCDGSKVCLEGGGGGALCVGCTCSAAMWWMANEVAAVPGHVCYPCYIAPSDGRDRCRNRLGIERTYVLNPDAFDGPCEAES